jgi:hypothetical protein
MVSKIARYTLSLICGVFLFVGCPTSDNETGGVIP